jgi:outer membrane beta-barrel protein
MIMTTRSIASSLLAVGAAAALAAAFAPSVAQADTDLDAQPAVRNRLLLVAKRLEATPLFESTINADFRAFIGGGLKLEYHLGDMLSIGAIGVVSASLDTKLTDKVIATLEAECGTSAGCMNDLTREPSKTEFAQHLNKIPFHGAVYVSLTPWYGKLAAFGRAYVNFDFYFQGGLALAQLTSKCESSICTDDKPGEGMMIDDPNDPDPSHMILVPDDNPNDDNPLNSGFKPGLYLGGGLHVFINDFMAIDLAVRDYAFTDNPSGADFNADLFVSDSDSRFLHHLFAGVGVSIMLPTKVKRTR